MHRHMMFSAAAALCLAAATDKGSGKSPVDQANANQASDAPDALKPSAAESTLEFSDLTGANLAVIELREQLAAAKTESEANQADAIARATAAERALEDLKARIASPAAAAHADEAQVGDDTAADELFSVRVKTPMSINPPAPSRYYDPEEDGPLPAPFPLVAGLNVGVPKWVADNWLVKANSVEEDPKQLPNPTAAEPDLA